MFKYCGYCLGQLGLGEDVSGLLTGSGVDVEVLEEDLRVAGVGSTALGVVFGLGGLATGSVAGPAACHCRQRWYEWRPGRHCACPAAGTRCLHVRCGHGVRRGILPVKPGLYHFPLQLTLEIVGRTLGNQFMSLNSHVRSY